MSTTVVMFLLLTEYMNILPAKACHAEQPTRLQLQAANIKSLDALGLKGVVPQYRDEPS